jgi:hypothetical protein
VHPEWVEKLLRLGEALERISAMPPVRGIEPLLRKSSDELLTARMMAQLIVHLGHQWARERIELEKPLASELRRIVRSGINTKTFSSRARALHRLLSRGDVEPIIRTAFEKAGVPLYCDDFREIAGAAAARDPQASAQLVEISRAVLPYLCDPRGRRVSAGTGIHLLLLHYHDGQRSYTWSPNDEDYVDPLTRATREFLNDPDFDPQPAYRLYRHLFPASRKKPIPLREDSVTT